MRRHFLRLVAMLVLAGAVAGPLASAPASGAAPNPNADCNANSRLTAHYTPAQLRRALATMPADVKEYTDCYDVIQRTLLADLGQLHGSGSGGRAARSYPPRFSSCSSCSCSAPPGWPRSHSAAGGVGA